MKEIRKPKFMQAAAVKRGHGIFAENDTFIEKRRIWND